MKITYRDIIFIKKVIWDDGFCDIEGTVNPDYCENLCPFIDCFDDNIDGCHRTAIISEGKEIIKNHPVESFEADLVVSIKEFQGLKWSDIFTLGDIF